MESISIVEILKVGLPGLVFLLSWLSYRLLNKEQDKEKPNISILKAIRNFMHVNIVLAVLTATSPIVEYFTQIKIFNIQAKAGNSNLSKGDAEVCHDANYKNRYLLVKDSKTERMIQVFSKTIIPCSTDERKIVLSEQDIPKLGWPEKNMNYSVEVAVAPPGYKFVFED